jgi:ATP-dependent Lhr-like helicase
VASPLDHFRPATREWFETAFEAPTPAQAGAWAAISRGENALVVAPTGSGKTLAAFLWSIDRLTAPSAGARTPGVRTLYVSPLKALAVDVERNLRSPLVGIAAAARRRGDPLPEIQVAMRTGDTPAAERRRLAREPADILITTPESLFLLLTSAAREVLGTVETVILDEVHAIAGTKRGAHLALSLERLDHRLERPAQRIGLSATVRPLDEAARFLGGSHPVQIVEAPAEKVIEVGVSVPVEDLTAIGEAPAIDGPETDNPDAAGEPRRASIWPHVEARVLELVREQRSTIIFANSRRLAERFCARLNELADEEIARAHHGSVSHDKRAEIEDALKMGRLRAVVATSSLELGIDMGAVDLVVQIECPDSIASGLQRIGRAGHHVGAVSRGILFPKFRGDLLESAAYAERLQARAIEEVRFPRNPLDVLAQHIVAMVGMDGWTVDDLERVILRAAPFAELPRSALEATLDMLAGRYPSDAFSGLRPRINWDREKGDLLPHGNARSVAVVSGGTIPDRGLFGVFLVGEKGARVGELDEEMVYESRVGDVFLLGASSWRIEEITADRVLVSPAPGVPGKMPFWHGDAPGRAAELGEAIGAFVREVGGAEPAARTERLRKAGLDENAIGNLERYLAEQRLATGALPDDRTIVLERFRDAIGDWRLCLHSFRGARVHAPWAQAIRARLRDRLGVDVQVVYGDDGIIVRIPDGDEIPSLDDLLFEPEDIEDLVVTEVASSALFAGRFRECAARSLLLPRRRPGQRTPLWLQRQKASTLLQVASRYGSFPIVLETYRECLRDVFDLTALEDLMRRLRSRAVKVVETETDLPSPFASSLQLEYIGAFLYEGEAPLAERRAQALALDRSVLAELMGREELRELLDPDVLTELELVLQRLGENRRATSADQAHELLLDLGALDHDGIVARSAPGAPVGQWLQQLATDRRAVEIRIGSASCWIAIEDASRYRDALGVALPVGLPGVFLEPVEDALGDLVSRYARTHGPFSTEDMAQALGLGPAVIGTALRALERVGRVLEGEFRPGGAGREWVDVEVLRRLRRRSLAALREEIEPVGPEALARFSIAWHDVESAAPRRSGPDALWKVIEQLQGLPLPASVFESQILRARIPGYTPALLDELGISGDLLWTGAGPLGARDGWIVLATADRAATLLPEPSGEPPGELAGRVLETLAGGGALFFRQISHAVGGPADDELTAALWDLVWGGHITNDTLAPLRAFLRGGRGRPAARTRRRAGNPVSRSGPPAAAGRFSLVPLREGDATRRAHARAEQSLRRHGVVTRGAVVADRVSGGFGAVYGVLKALEETGACRRGYFVDGLGGAQFALPGAVDRLRAFVEEGEAEGRSVVLAATDPANPFGASLPWPERSHAGAGHRAGRKAGALVVVVGGRLCLYVEKGGKRLLSFDEDPGRREKAVRALVEAARAGWTGRLEPQWLDGEALRGSDLEAVLLEAGFRADYRGFALRA